MGHALATVRTRRRVRDHRPSILLKSIDTSDRPPGTTAPIDSGGTVALEPRTIGPAVEPPWSSEINTSGRSRSGTEFAGFRFPPEVITLAVRWYLRFGLSGTVALEPRTIGRAVEAPWSGEINTSGRRPRSEFAGFRFPPEVITLAVRWYLRFGLSYRDVEELLAERGIEVDHTTLFRWVVRFTPLFIEAARPVRHTPGTGGLSTRPM